MSEADPGQLEMEKIRCLSAEVGGDVAFSTRKINFSGKCIKSRCLTSSGPGRLDRAAVLECHKGFVRRS